MWSPAAHAQDEPLVERQHQPRVAGVTTYYGTNSHADVILGRLMQTDTLDGMGAQVPLTLASLYVDQRSAGDISGPLAERYGVAIHNTVDGALSLGNNTLAVDGVLLIAEHGSYPRSDTGQVIYPKRRLFTEILEVFDRSQRVVPVFIDKHLADNWTDAKWIYDAARQRGIPLWAGSSLPTTWRYPPRDVPRGAPLREITAVSYGPLDAYGFHALEMVQCLAERRAGGETGVERVRCLKGAAVWQAAREGVYSERLLEACLERQQVSEPLTLEMVRQRVREPVLFHVVYRDGLKANLLTLNGAVAQWSAAWQFADESRPAESTLFWVQEERPFMHFAHLVGGISQLVHTSQSPTPVERTLLTSGLLDALLISHQHNGDWQVTEHLDIRYSSQVDWQQPE